MGNIDLPGFIMTVVGTAVLAINIWFFFFPRVLVSYVSVQLSEVSALLGRGEPLPNEDQFTTSLAILNDRFIRLRTESHRSPGFFEQLGRMISGLTCRLYVLRWDIDAFKRKVELAIDEQQLETDGLELAVLTDTQNVATTLLPDPATNTAAPANDVAEPTPLPPAAAP